MQLIHVAGSRDLFKLWSIPFLINRITPTLTSKVSVLIHHILMVSRSLYFKSFSMTFVNVFQSEGTDTSLSLQHQLAWSLITIYQVYSLTVPYLPVSPYPRELWLVLIPPL